MQASKQEKNKCFLMSEVVRTVKFGSMEL